MRIDRFKRVLAPGLIALTALAAACSDSDDPADAGVGPADTGVDIDIDMGTPDLGPPDLGPPPPCLWDQGGEAARGCPDGFVCNVESGECVSGKPCTGNADCNACSALGAPEDCGHGYPVTAWCDPTHGNVCTRSRAPCEPCSTDSDCGLVESLLRTGTDEQPNANTDVNRCLDYPDGNKYCGRPNTIGCPFGFQENIDSGQCEREQGCAEEPVFCPRSPTPGQGCPGREQICPGTTCPDTGGAQCATNNLPGSIGLCIGFCETNADCPPDRPVCNPNNGVCGAGCTIGSCPSPLVCHVDGFCEQPCATDDDCTMQTANNSKVYGTDMEVYCNIPGRSEAPRLYKGPGIVNGYRDDFSCAPLGCEEPVDCPEVGKVCDPTLSPPDCVDGCFTTEDDCALGFLCKSGPQGSYNREACRALPDKTSETEIGVCCDPGCLNRNLDCDLNQFCCAEPGSPFEDGDACPTLTNSSTVAAEPGECFDLILPPFCVIPDMDNPCDTGTSWLQGWNSDSDVMGGVPFKEQEFAFAVAVGMQQVPVCGVTCNPSNLDNACPRGWNCNPLTPGCLQDADCATAGLTCEGEDTSTNPPTPGRCKCGEDGVANITCPVAFGGPGANFGTIENPRCRDPELDDIGDMYCVAAYNCQGPNNQSQLAAPDRDLQVYPPECGIPLP